MTFERYATEQLPKLLGVSRAICGDPSLAEDLVQDVLIKIHSRWDLISGLDAPDAYVRRMLVNEFISWHRKWGRMRPHADAAGMADRQAYGGGSDHAAEHAGRAALLDNVRRLPTSQRLVIAMRYLMDLDDAEIATTLGCAQSTVRVHAARALAALRVELAADSAPLLPLHRKGQVS